MGKSAPTSRPRRKYEVAFSVPVELPEMTSAQRAAADVLVGKGATQDQIMSLRRRLRADLETIKMAQSNTKAGTGWSTGAELRTELIELADLADTLQSKLKGASPRAAAEISTAGWKRLGDSSRPSKLARELRLLAQGIRDRIEIDKVPTMSKAPVGFVRTVVAVLGSIAGTPSKATRSRFMGTCKAAFVLAGWDKDPKRAVEEYIESAGSQGDKMR